MAWNEIIIKNWNHFNETLEKVEIKKQSILPRWVYRGQANLNWELNPSLLRKLMENKYSKEIGLGVERMIYNEFVEKSFLYASKDFHLPLSNAMITWVCIMQHYSCPTRMLDWTGSPYVALFFAVEKEFDQDGVIYMFNNEYIETHFKDQIEQAYKKDINLFSYLPDDDVLIPLYPSYPTDRFILQKGFFTLSTNIIADHGDILTKTISKYETELRKFHIKLIIKKEHKKEFLSRLSIINIEYRTLFPGLDGLGKTLSNLIDIRAFIEENV